MAFGRGLVLKIRSCIYQAARERSVKFNEVAAEVQAKATELGIRFQFLEDDKKKLKTDQQEKINIKGSDSRLLMKHWSAIVDPIKRYDGLSATIETVNQLNSTIEGLDVFDRSIHPVRIRFGK